MGRSPDFGVMNWLRARLADVLNEAVVNKQGGTLQTAIVYTWIRVYTHVRVYVCIRTNSFPSYIDTNLE